MVMGVSDALEAIVAEDGVSQHGTPAPLSQPRRRVSSSKALAAPAMRVDISTDFEKLLLELREEEAAAMDVDGQGPVAPAHTQVSFDFSEPLTVL